MLKRIFALILAGISILWVATKALLKVASMAGTIDFLKNRLPSLIRVPQTAQWQLLAFVAGVAIGVFVDQIASSHSWHQANTEQVITTLAEKDEAMCPQPDKAKPRVTAIKPPISPRRAWQKQAAEMSSFEQEMERSSPPLVLSTSSADVTNRSLERSNEHNQQAVIRFVTRFSVPVANIIRDSRERGLDASPLEGHMAALNSIQMMRLVAADVSSLADQLTRSETSTTAEADNPEKKNQERPDSH